MTGLGPKEMDEAILMAHVLGNTVNTSGPAPGVFADTYDALVDEGTSIFCRYTFQESSLEPLKPLG